MDFMTSKLTKFKGEDIRVSRCGYTGEDGFEVSVPEKIAVDFAKHLDSQKDKSGKVFA